MYAFILKKYFSPLQYLPENRFSVEDETLWGARRKSTIQVVYQHLFKRRVRRGSNSNGESNERNTALFEYLCAGTFFVIPCIDNCVRVDLRTVSFDVPPQEVLTKDSVTVSVDAVVYYRIKEPLNAVVKIANYRYNRTISLYLFSWIIAWDVS